MSNTPARMPVNGRKGPALARKAQPVRIHALQELSEKEKGANHEELTRRALTFAYLCNGPVGDLLGAHFGTLLPAVCAWAETRAPLSLEARSVLGEVVELAASMRWGRETLADLLWLPPVKCATFLALHGLALMPPEAGNLERKP